MISQVDPKFCRQIKNLRLIGLQHDPTSFAASYDQEKSASLRYYRDKIKKSNSEDGFGYWGYFKEENLIGYAHLSREKLYHSNHLAHIYELIIHPDFRKHGFGRDLMEKLIELCQNHPDVTQVCLKCSSLNTNAQKLYKSLGFVHFATIKNSLFYEEIGYAHQLMYCLEV